MGEAQKLFDEAMTPAFARQPDGVNLAMTWANIMGRRGRWPEATAAGAFLLQLQPADHYNYHRLAGLLAMTGDRPAYEKICREIRTNFANPNNPYIAERIVQDSLLLPDTGVDLDAMDKLADTALARGSHEDGLPYFQACKAMAQYRLGHFADAVEWADKAMNSSAAQAQAKALAILAMAHWQLGQKEVARATLAKGNSLAPNLPDARGTVDLGDSWVAWIFARISLDEATALMRSGPTIESKSNRPQ
jgi:tetratricopeptide (TPR) repeat protein